MQQQITKRRRIALGIVAAWMCTPIPGCGLVYLPLVFLVDRSLIPELRKRLTTMKLPTVSLVTLALVACFIASPVSFFLVCWIVGIAGICVILLFLAICGFVRASLWWRDRKRTEQVWP